MTTCQNCQREIFEENGVWVDPEATGDDDIWRTVCDESQAFTAEHVPA